MKTIILPGLLVLLTLVMQPDAKASLGAGWDMIYDEDGIRGYEQAVEGTDLKTFKAETLIEAKIEVVGEVIRDIPAYPEWMAKCTEATVLKDIDRNTKIFYNEVDVPWPIPNRGVIITNTTHYDLSTGRAEIKFNSLTSEEYSVREGTVQITDLTGMYLLEFFGRELTRVTYTHKADPGGLIPIKLSNLRSRMYPVINLKGLKKMVKLKKYQELGEQCEEHRLLESMLLDRAAVEAISKNRVSEYVHDANVIEMVFKDRRIVDRVIKDGGSFESIKNMLIDTCSAILENEMIRDMYRNKRLREILVIERFLDNRLVSSGIATDPRLVTLIMNDRQMLQKILTDSYLLEDLLDSSGLAGSISRDPLLVEKLVDDSVLKEMILKNLETMESRSDLRKIVKDRVEILENQIR